MNKFIRRIKNFWRDDEGLSAVEYVVAGALVIAVLVGGFTTLGNTLSGKLTELTDSITTTSGGSGDGGSNNDDSGDGGSNDDGSGGTPSVSYTHLTLPTKRIV